MNPDRHRRFPWLFEPRRQPRAIAHRGASDYAFDNSPQAFNRAAMLGADWIEVDVRTTADGVLVAWHDRTTRQLNGIAEPIQRLTFAELQHIAAAVDRQLPRFDTVLDIACEHGLGVYVDAKDATALRRASDSMAQREIVHGIVASFDAERLAELTAETCAYPRSILVPRNGDWSTLASRSSADLVQLCGLHSEDLPQDRLTTALFAEAQARALPLVLWHEERRHVLDTLLTLPVFGIFSNRPEMLNANSVGAAAGGPIIICHRGHRHVAPENTLAAAGVAYSAGYAMVGLDVRGTRDGELVVLADETVNRTTDGHGQVADISVAELSGLDAGSWFDSYYSHVTVPTLDEMFEFAAMVEGGVYLNVKAGLHTAVCDKADAHGMLERCLIGCRDPNRLDALRARAADMRVVCQRQDFAALEHALGVCASGPPRRAVIEFDADRDLLAEVSDARASGCATMVRYLGDDPHRFRDIATVQPDYLNLDRPDLWRRATAVT